MLQLAGLGSRALGLRPWRWVSGRWQRLSAAPPESSQPSAASRRRPRPAVAWRGSVGSLPWMVENKQMPFGHVESLCCFSTSSSHKDSEYGRLIYRGNLAKAVAGVKFFSYSTSMLNIAIMTYISLGTGFDIDSLPLKIALYSGIGFFTFVTPVMLHFFTKGYVIRLYHKAETDTYTAFTYNIILAEKKTVFHQKEVKVPDLSKMFTSFYANTKSMLVNPMVFEYPQDYNHLMGYDRPFTFDQE
uniref:Transmembrane protein 70, mitochondrial n=1 Tax=Pogona vitticeps TaxID=103695 RepID=A0A6J0V6Q7_9SAUR|nr:transmembrane protein 70, mitochondrial [Pogona vitticeps]